MTDATHYLPNIELQVNDITLAYYMVASGRITMIVDTDKGQQRIVLNGLASDLAVRMMNALADPGTPVYHGSKTHQYGTTTTPFGDWIVAEQIIDKLTGDPPPDVLPG